MISKDLVIHTTGLGVNFGNVSALKDVSMEVGSGTIFGFLGPNGAGKTTTIRVLLGLLKPAYGTADVMGFNSITHADQIRQNSGVLLEHNGLYETLSAEDNLEYFARIWDLSYNERKERIKQLLTHIGLWDRRKEKIGNWSKGMKQKLAVARCILHRPALIFLDEPTSGLDPVATVALRTDLLSIVKKEGSSIFLTTHNLDEAEKMCDTIGVINKGKLLAISTPSDLKERSNKTYRYEITVKGISVAIIEKLKAQVNNDLSYNGRAILIELPVTKSISPVVAAIIAEGVEVDEVNKIQANMEQAYLKIMEENK